MSHSRECPMCGETMRIKEREMTERIPGRAQTVKRAVREWYCPGCDYYEEEEKRQEPGP